MEKLTTKQEMILQIIKKWIAKYGYPPTVREIGEEAHLNSPATIHFHLTKLEEKGYITKGNGKNRTIEVLVPNEYLEKEENVVEVPLLGKVTAGKTLLKQSKCQMNILPYLPIFSQLEMKYSL